MLLIGATSSSCSVSCPGGANGRRTSTVAGRCPAAELRRPHRGGTRPPATRTGRPGCVPTGIRTFISALDKVALVNGISRRRPGLLNAWLHGTIARRVEFLEGVLVDRRVERQFQRRLGLLKWGMLTVLVAGLAALAAGQWDQIRPLVWPA